jgi:hypothetical protein
MARDGAKSENDCYRTEEAIVGIVFGDKTQALFEKCETDPLNPEHIRQCDALEARVEAVDREVEEVGRPALICSPWFQ